MGTPLDNVSCANIPRERLEALADLRHLPGILVAPIGDRAWIRWNPSLQSVLERILPIPDIQLFTHHKGFWYQPGRHLPDFNLPIETSPEQLPLASVLLPDKIEGIPEPTDLPAPLPITWVRDDEPRPATALTCSLAQLGQWAETSLSSQFDGLLGAHSGERVLILGADLPALPGAQRYWGERIFLPLGSRLNLRLSEPALCRALQISTDEFAIFAAHEFEIIPRTSLRPLSRASVRLALQGGEP